MPNGFIATTQAVIRPARAAFHAGTCPAASSPSSTSTGSAAIIVETCQIPVGL